MDEIKNGAEEIYLAPETNESEEVLSSKEETSEEIKNEDVTITLEPEQKKKLRVNEILELREANRKVYRMSDGTEQAVFYAKNIHTLDDNTNTFNEMDNAVVEETDGKYFTNAKKDFKAKFSREKNDELFGIESGNYRVTVFAKTNTNKDNKNIKAKLCDIETKGVAKDVALVFAGVQSGADYEYSVVGDGVKENIVVKEKSDIYRYQFVIRPENVSVKLDETDKSIAFVSNATGEEVFFIPAPFMSDASGSVSTAVSYDCKNAANGDILLDVVADSEWINAEERIFPVVIDPQICLSGSSAMTTYSWDNGYISKQSLHTIATHRNADKTNTSKRMYMSFNMPTLPRNPRIKKAELRLCQMSSSSACCGNPKLGLYRVTDAVSTGTCTPGHDSNLIDFAKMRIGHCEDGEVVSYNFDITTLVDQVNKGEVGVNNLVLKMVDEASECDNSVTLYGDTYGGEFAPQIVMTYESSYGVNTSYRTHTHELGRFGQGSIDLQCGNLMFESEDFAWAGNRMPVTIKHLYNSALADCQYSANAPIKLQSADFSSMKIGNGFKLNLMQSITAASFQHEGELFNGYVYVGENGEETYFKMSEKQVCSDDNSHCYKLYEDVNGGEMLYDPEKRTIKQGDDTHFFDSLGRFFKIIDSSNNCMEITYDENKIKSVTDAIGREFTFEYEGTYLTSITAPDDSKISYTYSGDLLSTITYPDGKKVAITYDSATSKPSEVRLEKGLNECVYKVAYTFIGNRVASVTEYGSDNSIGAKSTYSYSAASGRTIVTTTEQADGDEAAKEIKTVYTFDDEGNIVSDYVYSEETGNVGVEGEASGIHPYSGAGVVSNINNLLKGHNFDSLEHWSSMPGNCEDLYISNYAYEPYTKFGKKLLRMESCCDDCIKNGVYQVTNTLPAGQYTLSAYLRVISDFSGANAGAYIRVTDTSGNVLGVSERLSAKDSEYTRLIVPFELTTAQSVQVQILADGKGVVYADAAQLENNPYANAYNALENGNFESTSGWNFTSGTAYNSGTCFNMTRSLMINGDLETNRNAYQSVKVKSNRTTRETFTLSGWAKGYGLPNYERDGVMTPTFRLRAVIKYNDSANRQYGTEEFTADFSPCTEEWQFAAIEFAKSKCCTVEDIKVYCDYGFNTGWAYFDDIQLVRNSIETDLSASDFDTGIVDETEDTNDDVNMAEETSDTTPEFEELVDTFGNALTETTFTDGEFGTIYRSFGFNNSCNDLIRETDSRGNTTTYTVNEETSRNEEVIDRCGNKTVYDYDAAGNTTKVTSITANGTELANVSYAYDAFDNMTEIVRGDGMKYVLKYNAFHNLETIAVKGDENNEDINLIKYTYKNGNGRLKEMTYANGDTMKATYNGIGQMVAEKWFNKNNTLTAHYKYVYDGEGNIVLSIDILAEKEYTYQYEEGKIIRATECNIELDDNQFVVAKTVVNTIKYCYDSEGTMTKKVITAEDGTSQTIYYEQSEDDNTVVKFVAGGKTITSHSKSDSFGRKEFDELQLGTGFVARQFHYHAGEITEEHQENAKLKSSATTQLVSQIVLSNGTTISYAYDAEERITSVVETYTVDDSTVTNTTHYTYDALGQLLTETTNDNPINTMTYDYYGNIKTKNGVVYDYDTIWKDKLIKVGGKSITYDAQGNPTNYLGHNLTWEKGRQLKSFDGNTYTYNANGIRTSKTVDGVRHDFVLDGAKILRECWNFDEVAKIYRDILVPLYDNEDSVCGIIYNNVPYYFQKNLQGDIIGIVDKNSAVVARYSYDAWGKCTIDPTTTNVTIANINPFRYRGYYFDQGTNLYYLQSRYYDAEVGRFINGDMPEVLILEVQNMYSYCFDSPITMTDNDGKLPKFIKNSLKVIKGMVTSSIFDIIISTPYAASGGVYVLPMVAKAISNFKKNNKLEKQSPITGYIKNQNSYSDWFLGMQRLSKCGCELIAVYNILRSKGKTRTLASLALQFELSGYVMAWGYLGSSPTKLWSCFTFAGLKYGMTSLIGKLEKKVKKYGCGIISCWNSGLRGGLHTFMIEYDGEKFSSLNGYSKPENAATLSKLISNRKMIVGYWFK